MAVEARGVGYQRRSSTFPRARQHIPFTREPTLKASARPLRLARYFDTSLGFSLNLQLAVDLYDALLSESER